MREVVYEFYGSRYAACLARLQRLLPLLRLDLHLAPHVDHLHAQARPGAGPVPLPAAATASASTRWMVDSGSKTSGEPAQSGMRAWGGPVQSSSQAGPL